MKAIAMWIAAAVMSVVAVADVYAAEVSIGQFNAKADGSAGDHYISLNGPIEEGDLERLQQAYYDSRIKVNPVLWLNSPGGSGAEMDKIIEWMDNVQFRARVWKDDMCMSACAAIWAHASFQLMYDGARIGFHVGSIPDGGFLEDYVRDNGHLGMQRFHKYNSAMDFLFYADFPVKDQFSFVKKIMEFGSYDAVFWEISAEEAENIIGAYVVR